MDVPGTLVDDANILFSFFQVDSGRRRLIKQLRSDGCQLTSPDYVLAELSAEKERIQRFANISEFEFVFLFSLLERTVTTIEREGYRDQLVEAEKLAPHEKDVPYFGLALHEGVPIRSDESAFNDQGTVSIFTTQDLFSVYEKSIYPPVNQRQFDSPRQSIK